MKYRIIHKYDLNGDGHYEAQFQVKFLGLSWWRTLKQYTLHTHRPICFDTCGLAEAAAVRYCSSLVRFRDQVAEGEVP